MTRILIADPNSASRKALTLLLIHKLGVEEVFEATDVDSLLLGVKAALPDILLLDDCLPGLNHPETCHRLQADFPNLKIALLSLDESACDKALFCGAEFIHKGASLDETLSVLQTILGETK